MDDKRAIGYGESVKQIVTLPDHFGSSLESEVRECSIFVCVQQEQPSNFKRFVEVGRGTWTIGPYLSRWVSISSRQSSSSSLVLKRATSPSLRKSLTTTG